jgi:hypothetical protein
VTGQRRARGSRPPSCGDCEALAAARAELASVDFDALTAELEAELPALLARLEAELDAALAELPAPGRCLVCGQPLPGALERKKA